MRRVGTRCDRTKFVQMFWLYFWFKTSYFWSQCSIWNNTSIIWFPLINTAWNKCKGKVNFQPVNTGRGAHLPLETNWARLIFRCVGLATPPPQRACYLPGIAGIHLYTWVERSNYGEVPYSRTQHVDRNGARTHNLSVYESSTDPLDHKRTQNKSTF